VAAKKPTAPNEKIGREPAQPTITYAPNAQSGATSRLFAVVEAVKAELQTHVYMYRARTRTQTPLLPVMPCLMPYVAYQITVMNTMTLINVTLTLVILILTLKPYVAMTLMNVTLTLAILIITLKPYVA
jgi:hypothetical protein